MAFLDTHKAIEKIIATGVSKETAEAIVESVNIRNDDVATKSDISELRTEFKAEMSELKTDISWLKVISIANFTVLLSGLVSFWFK